MARVHVWIIGNFSEANGHCPSHGTVEDCVGIVKIIRKSRSIFAQSSVSWTDLFIYSRLSGICSANEDLLIKTIHRIASVITYIIL